MGRSKGGGSAHAKRRRKWQIGKTLYENKVENMKPVRSGAGAGGKKQEHKIKREQKDGEAFGALSTGVSPVLVPLFFNGRKPERRAAGNNGQLKGGMRYLLFRVRSCLVAAGRRIECGKSRRFGQIPR